MPTYYGAETAYEDGAIDWELEIVVCSIQKMLDSLVKTRFEEVPAL